MSKVFLVVLSHNSLDTTKKFLDLLYKYTDPNLFHLYFIDNGSSDETPKFLQDFRKENMSILLSESNTGVIGGRNLGFDSFMNHTEYDTLMFLDNDQYVREGWFEQHMDVLNTGYDMIGVEAWRLSPTFIPLRKLTSLNDTFNYVGCGGMLVRREVVDKIGSYDMQFNPSYYEDPDYNKRAHDAGFKIGWNIKSKIIHFPHQTLGKAADRSQRFMNSLQKFRNKWKGQSMPLLKQYHIPAFE